MQQSPRLGLDEAQTSDNISAFPGADQQAMGILDDAVLITQGTLASRPATAALGNLYYATDTGSLFMYQSAGWQQLAILGSSTSVFSGAVSATTFEGPAGHTGVALVENNGHQVEMTWTGSTLQFTVDGASVSVA